MRDRGNSILVFVICVFALVAVLYARTVPAWQPSDEPFHFLYAEKILQRGELPSRDENYQALHPPVYYALMAAASLPVRGLDYARQLLYMRLLNVALGVLSLLVLYRAGLAAGFGRAASTAAVAVAASIPMLTVSFASVNNDNLAILTAWLAIWSFCAMSGGGAGLRQLAVCALLSGLAFGTKSNNAFVVPLFVMFYFAYQRELKPARVARDAVVFIALFTVSGMWWHLYAYSVYGNLVFGNPVNEIKPFALWLPGNFARWLRVFFGTFWMYVDYLRNVMPRRPEMGYYCFFLAATLLMLAGAVRELISRDGPRRRLAAWLLLGGFLLGVLEIWAYNRVSFVGSARYAFPAMAGLMILWGGGGWSGCSVAGRSRRRWCFSPQCRR